MKLLNFTIIKLTICLVAGILLGFYMNIGLTTSLIISIVLLGVLFVLYVLIRNQVRKTLWFGLIGYLTMTSIGVLTVNLHNPKHSSHHYSHYLSIENDTVYTITFKVKEVLKPSQYSNKYVVEVLRLYDRNVNGKSLLNIRKDSVQETLQVDDVYCVRTNFKPISRPLNPGQFDYSNYLEKKYIYHQLYASTHFLLKLESSKTTIYGIANSIRSYLNQKLKPYNFKPDEIAIINALLLGQRQDISEDIYTSYANAGAIHILAVSGLHIGIILLLLNILLKPIERINRGKLIKTIILVMLLWSFAVIAGLSPSVTRAVTMFSIVAVAMNLKRPTNIFNTLAISMFLILLFRPLFVFEVGFQLSYLAVFAIAIIDPLLYRLWKPKHWLIDLYWHTLTVTIAAQIGILPLSLFYFHQFPGLFFVTNLVIIPGLGIILGLGLIVLILAALGLLPSILANSFGYVIGLMNNFVGWVAQQDAFLFKDIPFSIAYVLVSYGMIVLVFRWFFKKTYRNLKWVLIAVIFVQCALLYSKSTQGNNEFIVFHKTRHSLIGQVYQNTMDVGHDLDSLVGPNTSVLRNYQIKTGIKALQEHPIKSVYVLNEKKILVIDSLAAYNISAFQPDYVLLRQSPKVNLNRLIDSIQPKYIIADGSNYTSYIKRWETICIKRKLPFYHTGKKGAFILNY